MTPELFTAITQTLNTLCIKILDGFFLVLVSIGLFNLWEYGKDYGHANTNKK